MNTVSRCRRSCLNRPAPTDFLRSTLVAVEARDVNGDYRNGLKPVVRVDLASGRSAEIATHQTAPGRYEATVVADPREPVAISVGGVEGARPASRLVIPDPHAELRFRKPDERRLRAIAEATGGAWTPSAAAIRQMSGAGSTARRALWPWLVIAALVFWLHRYPAAANQDSGERRCRVIPHQSTIDNRQSRIDNR